MLRLPAGEPRRGDAGEAQLREEVAGVMRDGGVAGGGNTHWVAQRDEVLAAAMLRHGPVAASSGVDAKQLHLALAQEQQRRMQGGGNDNGNGNDNDMEGDSMVLTGGRGGGEGDGDGDGVDGGGGGGGGGADGLTRDAAPDDSTALRRAAGGGAGAGGGGGGGGDTGTLQVLAQMRHSQAAYAVTFNELVRQVSVGCVERGQLLAKVWGQYLSMFDKLVGVSACTAHRGHNTPHTRACAAQARTHIHMHAHTCMHRTRTHTHTHTHTHT